MSHESDKQATSLAAGDGKFPPTLWSVVLLAGQDSSERAREALTALCRAYWFPLYAFLRRQGKSPHDAEDFPGGGLRILATGTLCAPSAPVTVAPGGNLVLFRPGVFDHPLSLNGNMNPTIPITWVGNVSIGGTNAQVAVSLPHAATFAGTLSGSAPSSINGNTFTFASTGSYSGIVTGVNEERFVSAHSGSSHADP